MRTPILALITLLIGACASPPRKTPSPSNAQRLPNARGLSNVARITPNLYRGAQPDDDGYRTLKKMGVKTIISFRNFFSSEKNAEAAGLQYLSIPIYASIGSSAPTDAQVKLFFDTVLDPRNQPVYIHCQHGKDRTGMMAAIYRIEREGWTNEEAIEEMQAFGYHDIFRDLIGFVRKYEPRGFTLRR